jgi:lysine-N-methylase
MKENGRCPFLDERGLCRIISECGEDYLSDICRLHPRYFNYFENHAEIGLGMVCEEAARLILSEDDPFTMIPISEVAVCDAVSSDFAFEQRDKILDILKKDTRLSEKLDEIKALYTVSESVYSFDEWKSIFSELEVLDEEWSNTLLDAEECECAESDEKYFERFITYLVYRHIPRSESEENLRAVIGFILVSYEMVKNVYYSQDNRSFVKLCDIMRLYSSEIEYCEDNVAALIFEFESVL